MYDVEVREMPEREVLGLERRVHDDAEVRALGTEFVGLVRGHDIPRPAGIAGSVFLVYHGEVSEDSDGPVEMCHPVAPEAAERVAAELPMLVRRIEPAHREAVVHLGTDELPPSEWGLIADALREWAEANDERPSPLGARVTFTVDGPATTGSRPDCEFVVPLVER